MTVFATGASARYGYHLLNLLGSLHVNSDVFDHVVAYDLGLTPHQRGLLDRIRNVEVRTVPPFVPHWSQGFTWKPWIWTHLDVGNMVVWVDAGDTILRSLRPVLEHVREHGYFLVSQGRELHEIVPSDYYELYGLGRERARSPYVAAGIVGFRVGSGFYDRVVAPTYRDCLAGRSLGFSAAEAPALNRDLHATSAPVIRDCKHFRWDQTVFNIRLAIAYDDPVVNDLDRYAGYRSPRDHPQQVIWNHRRQGNMAYLWRVPYEHGFRLRGLTFGLRYRVLWWRKLHKRLFMPSTYRWKLRKIANSLRRAPA